MKAHELILTRPQSLGFMSKHSLVSNTNLCFGSSANNHAKVIFLTIFCIFQTSSFIQPFKSLTWRQPTFLEQANPSWHFSIHSKTVCLQFMFIIYVLFEQINNPCRRFIIPLQWEQNLVTKKFSNRSVGMKFILDVDDNQGFTHLQMNPN